MHALVEAGADIIELGVPFSDPMADGPVIQRAGERALKHGVGLADVLGMVREFRKKDDATPIVLMGYANPIEAMGVEKFVAAAKAAGVDGVIVVDYPPEECEQFAALAKKRGHRSDLPARAHLDRQAHRAGRRASAAATSTTSRCAASPAPRTSIFRDVAARIPKIRAATKLPIGVGFGIRDAESARRVAQTADAVVIGSRIIQEIEAGARRPGGGAGQGVPETRSGRRWTPCSMSWLQKLLPPKIQRTGAGARKTVPEGLWTKCAACDAVLYSTDLEKNLNVCPKCGHHERLGARPRLDALLDPDGRFEIGSEVLPVDTLKFKDSRRYTERLAEAQEETAESDALVVMQGSIKALGVVCAAFEFDFMGGSMGSVVGERFVRGVRVAIEQKLPFVCVTASGGARMQEGAAVARADGEDHRRAHRPRRARACRSSRCSPTRPWAACRRASP